MTKLSTLAKRPFLIGSATLAAAFLALSLSGSAQAAMSAKEFVASLDDLKQVCHRLDQPMWIKRQNSGCGNVVKCFGRRCYYKPIIIVDRDPPTLTPVKKVKTGNDHEGKSRGRQSPGLL
ncbi:hypothetical protein BH10PSE7_BH10PSE7_21820 [soil metagenome]